MQERFFLLMKQLSVLLCLLCSNMVFAENLLLIYKDKNTAIYLDEDSIRLASPEVTDYVRSVWTVHTIKKSPNGALYKKWWINCSTKIAMYTHFKALNSESTAIPKERLKSKYGKSILNGNGDTMIKTVCKKKPKEISNYIP